MNRDIEFENDDPYPFLEFAFHNIKWGRSPLLIDSMQWIGRMTRHIAQFNPIGRSRRNVAHHYDLSGELYDLFLDADRQYSCAYFMDPTDSLEQAQLQKKRHIASKLLIEPGMKVLDIGSGWGGLAIYLAQTTGADVTGITLSEEQLRISNQRAAELGLEKQVRFCMRDYRQETNRYDRIVSVGMFEHVGVTHYQTYFNQVQRLLTPNGVALIHSIGRAEGPSTTNAWLAKYIFPGGYTPAISEVVPTVEKAQLHITDIEVLRLHYAETLKAWRQRFRSNWDRLREIYDERFCRMWDFYLASCEAAFRAGDQIVFQLQVSPDINAVPITRDYMFEWERRSNTKTDRIAAAE